VGTHFAGDPLGKRDWGTGERGFEECRQGGEISIGAREEDNHGGVCLSFILYFYLVVSMALGIDCMYRLTLIRTPMYYLLILG